MFRKTVLLNDVWFHSYSSSPWLLLNYLSFHCRKKPGRWPAQERPWPELTSQLTSGPWTSCCKSFFFPLNHSVSIQFKGNVQQVLTGVISLDRSSFQDVLLDFFFRFTQLPSCMLFKTTYCNILQKGSILLFAAVPISRTNTYAQMGLMVYF